jgi:glucan phosphoethanolaminetransferase (alkaline phosphatase superfamily)
VLEKIEVSNMAKKNVKNYIYLFLLSIFPSFSVYLSSYDQLMFFLITLILFIILRFDFRFLIILGIINLIFSALFFFIPLGNIAYFYLLFGIIGIIIQDFLGSKLSNKANEKARKKKTNKRKQKSNKKR